LLDFVGTLPNRYPKEPRHPVVKIKENSFSPGSFGSKVAPTINNPKENAKKQNPTTAKTNGFFIILIF
jgi:hypothetical protein